MTFKIRLEKIIESHSHGKSGEGPFPERGTATEIGTYEEQNQGRCGWSLVSRERSGLRGRSPFICNGNELKTVTKVFTFKGQVI